MPAFQTSHFERLDLELGYFVNLHEVIIHKGNKLHRLKVAWIFVVGGAGWVTLEMLLKTDKFCYI